MSECDHGVTLSRYCESCVGDDGTAAKFSGFMLGAITMFGIIMVVALLASCAHLSAPGLSPREQHSAALELTVECVYPAPLAGSPQEALLALMGGMPKGGWGSAVAVSPSHALTARHVIDCDLELPFGLGTLAGEPMKLTLTMSSGASVEAVVLEEGATPDDDFASLVAVEGSRPFDTWAAISDHNPRMPYKDAAGKEHPGEMMCVAPAHPFRGRRCGELQTYEKGDEWMGAGYVIYDAHSDPGNSGSGVYGEDGKLMAIHVASVGRSAGGGYIVGRWRGRVPRAYADLELGQ